MQQTTFLTLLRCSRPSFLLLTPCCLSVALAFAVAEGYPINNLNLGLIVLGAVSAHISVNLLNEYADFRSGLDLNTHRTPFSGGSGALPSAPQCAETMRRAGLCFLMLTMLIGLYFIWHTGWGLLPIGCAGVLLVYCYSSQITRRPIICLLAPGLGFGPLMILGTYYLLTSRLQPPVITASLIIMLLVSNLLLLNQFPDLEPDRKAGRRHLPILLGRKKSALIYIALLALAYILLLQSVYIDMLPVQSLGALSTLLLAIPTSLIVLKFHDDLKKITPALGMNVALTLTMPLLIALGIVWSSI